MRKKLTTLVRTSIYRCVPGINVTWKTGDPEVSCFAPLRHVSQDFIHGLISWEVYREKYLDKLNSIPQEVLMPAVKHIYNAGDEVTLICYCPPTTKHCHLALLIDWLVFRFPKAFEKPQCQLF